MQSHTLVVAGLISLTISGLCRAQQVAPTPLQAPQQKSQNQWQELPISNEPPFGMNIWNGNAPFEDWVAASYKDHKGELYTRDDNFIGTQMVYSVEGSALGSYVFDPIITSDKVIFRFGKIENPIDGFNLLYVDKLNGAPISVHWLNPATRLYNNRIELSPSSRYIAYMTVGTTTAPEASSTTKRWHYGSWTSRPTRSLR